VSLERLSLERLSLERLSLERLTGANLVGTRLDVRISIDGLAETSFNGIYDPFLSFLKALERGCFHKLYRFEAVATCLPHMLLDGIFMR